MMMSLVAEIDLVSGIGLHGVYLLCGIALIYAGDLPIKLSAAVFSVFQYSMMWDVFLNPTTETWLFTIYPSTAFVLHLAIILSIIKHGVAKNGSVSAVADNVNYWFSSFKCNLARNQSN